MDRRFDQLHDNVTAITGAEAMTAEKVRDLALSLKAIADQLAEAGDVGGAHNLRRQSERWLAYDAWLATKPGEAQP